MYIIDQHAAQKDNVRAAYRAFREGKMASQALLEPVVVDVSPIEMER